MAPKGSFVFLFLFSLSPISGIRVSRDDGTVDPRISDLFHEADMTSRARLRKCSDHVAVMVTKDKEASRKKHRHVVLTLYQKVEITITIIHKSSLVCVYLNCMFLYL